MTIGNLLERLGINRADHDEAVRTALVEMVAAREEIERLKYVISSERDQPCRAFSQMTGKTCTTTGMEPPCVACFAAALEPR